MSKFDYILVGKLEVLHVDERQIFLQIRRRLVKSFVDMLILSKLKEKSMSGYDIISLIYRKFRILLGSGSVYSLLYSMERKGLIKGTWDERKRIYMLTPKGEETIKAALNSYEGIENFITMLLSK